MSAPAAFAAAEAVRSGEWDDYLLALKQAIHDRERILQDEENVPPQTVTMQASGDDPRGSGEGGAAEGRTMRLLSAKEATARAIVNQVMVALEAEDVWLWFTDVGAVSAAFERAVKEVATLLDPTEKFDAEV
jgi:hypothetical protein